MGRRVPGIRHPAPGQTVRNLAARPYLVINPPAPDQWRAGGAAGPVDRPRPGAVEQAGRLPLRVGHTYRGQTPCRADALTH
jgi:hypothetical protein